MFYEVRTLANDLIHVDGICYAINKSEKTAEVTMTGNYDGDVIIPSSFTIQEKDGDKTYGGKYLVKGIGMEAFMHCRNLTSITIPNSVRV